MKKLLKLTALVIGLVLAIGFVSCNQGNDAKSDTVDVTVKPGDETDGFPAQGALKSIKAVEGVPKVYTAEFEGDYFLDDTINANLRTSTKLLSYLKTHVRDWEAEENESSIQINVTGAACSSIVAKNADPEVGGYIYGRNFDWDDGTSLILHTKPESGYESVSTCYMGFVSILNPDWAPNDNESNNLLALCCIYVPMDGMNEKGLYIANLQNDTDPIVPAGDDTKKYVQTTVAIRYILDKCATVAEAVEWLKTINMCPVYAEFPGYPDYHFAIADNSGKYAVVEWIEGEIQVIESRVVTNHSLYKQRDTENNYETYGRYDTLEEFGEAKDWKLDADDVAAALYEVQQKHSLWSAVFEPGAKRVTYYFRKADPTAGITEPEHTGDPEDPEFQQSEYYEPYIDYLNELHDAKHHPIDYATPVVVQF